MTMRERLMGLLLREDVNFALTNKLPRRSLTRLMGGLSKIENRLVSVPSIALWRYFADPDLEHAEETRFRSLHHAFTRGLKPGARAYDPDPEILASPCDAIVGACGRIEAGRLYQVKGRDYALRDLLDADAGDFAGGTFATLRLTAGMYHRFHAPHDLIVDEVRYIPGDAWNVNRAALNRVEHLYCRNERAVIATRLAASGHSILLVPVAAILVAGIRLHFAGNGALLREGGARTIPCDATLSKGEEMGWFEHGSTIIVIAPSGFELAEGIADGARMRAGQALMRLP
jgi:phosphatidylserine decarboxylase